MRKRTVLSAILLPALAIAAPQAVLRWQADAASPAPEPFAATILQGESIGLECRLRGADIPAGATASFLWQTNGMASAWWETNATVTASNGAVRADWTPAMDCGADSYRFFLRVDAQESALYRAYGVLRMRPSPGATPNALPMPRPVLDFSAFEVLNPPWEESSPEEEPSEYAQPYYSYIVQHPIYGRGGLATNDWLDVTQISYASPGIHSVRLEAVRDEQGGMSPPETLPGEWSIIAGTDIATLEGDTLFATTNTGPVIVQFDGADGTVLTETVPMVYRPSSSPLLSPGGEQEIITWRRDRFDYVAGFFRAIDPDGPTHTYRHGDYECEILDALQQYSYAYQPNPTVRNPSYAFLRTSFSSVGRTDESTSGNRRPVTAISPHYAICAAHSSADGATFVDVGGTVYTRSYRAVATRGDLRLLRTETALPEDVFGPVLFLRASSVASKSPTILAEGLGFYQSQHGTVHPCLVTPMAEGGGWTTHPVGEAGNYTYADLAPFAHEPHTGDSGHCVFFVINDYYVPVGLFYTARGSAESLMDGAVIDWLNANMVGESVQELSEGDL